ncbi:uncharacterized protein LOC107776877 [Nicotiana tabacum]|uniref:Isopentenyl-diphosphate delta-isomerase n=2 Tax=Nicotiana TaxID=4085 RepID=A0A1S3YK26_TOBAC|nr:PREDICTED: uncharacterized protein LOC104237116 [Nicotiana sylvestris]XP_009789505.1 PREDICTED: uncharacterized protein LOC104237116 [Nicotiana sylvestris]XP_016452307.1 PREDICTED: uncharacterized protein LOC107776877 [Nicotiana tabacum]XP_016452308.1 PREDICTED: uncharacterized protein LOC107776877 [Nicotiana tabacum]
MAGIAIVLDLLRKNPSFTGQTLNSYGAFSAKVAASAAAASSVAATYPFAARAFFGNGAAGVAFCDAGTGFSEDYISSIPSESIINFQYDSLKHSTKQYNIELKPLFSAFMWRNLALTSLRSFLLFYLPLLEPRANMEDEDDEDFLQDTEEDRRVDLVTPFKKSVKQIGRETAVVTTRRVLERLAVHYVSQRMAWKLLKDVPKSAARKAQRGMPSVTYFCSVTRTTSRGHFLGVLASWFVQVGIDIWRFFKSKQDDDMLDRSEKAQLLGRKIYIATVRCGASLVFASIGAGIGAMMFRPTTGQWIGCAIGDVAGPVIVAFCFDKVLHIEL